MREVGARNKGDSKRAKGRRIRINKIKLNYRGEETMNKMRLEKKKHGGRELEERKGIQRIIEDSREEESREREQRRRKKGRVEEMQTRQAREKGVKIEKLKWNKMKEEGRRKEEQRKCVTRKRIEVM